MLPPGRRASRRDGRRSFSRRRRRGVPRMNVAPEQQRSRSALSVGRNTRSPASRLELDPVLSPDGRTLAYSAPPPDEHPAAAARQRRARRGQHHFRRPPAAGDALRPSWRRGRSVGRGPRGRSPGAQQRPWSLDAADAFAPTTSCAPSRRRSGRRSAGPGTPEPSYPICHVASGRSTTSLTAPRSRRSSIASYPAALLCASTTIPPLAAPRVRHRRAALLLHRRTRRKRYLERWRSIGQSAIPSISICPYR